MRAGGYVLSLLAAPGVTPVLRAMEAESISLAGLRRALGSPPQTTLRTRLKELADLKVLERHRESDFPRSVTYALTGNGRELLAVADTLEHWLTNSPRPSIRLGDIVAKHAVKALVDGWNAGIVATLAATPLSLTQIGQEITDLSYPSLERRISAMRDAGLLEPGEPGGHGTPCLPTRWLRTAAAPIAAAASFERRYVDAGRKTQVDAATLLMLAMPVALPPRGASGTATLATRQPGIDGQWDRPSVAGVTVELREGLMHKCFATGPEGTGPNWAFGAPDAWLETAVKGTFEQLEFGGVKPELATGLARSFHEALQIGESIV